MMGTNGTPSLGDDASDEFGDAIAGFRSSLSSILGSPETERRIVELFEAYAAVLHDAMQSPRVTSRAAERYEPYARAVADAFADVGARDDLERAFATYVDRLQQAWATLDTTSLDPADLASIAEEMQWVAGVMGVVHSMAAAVE
jgi:hypothetical protein